MQYFKLPQKFSVILLEILIELKIDRENNKKKTRKIIT